MSSFVGIPLFVLLLLPGLVSELMYISVQFFNSQEGISDYTNSSPLPQTIYAQDESDYEEIDENDGGDDNVPPRRGVLRPAAHARPRRRSTRQRAG